MTIRCKKDQSIPPSRSIANQRDYRARKTQYVYNLEEWCRVAEEENRRLRREIELTKAMRLQVGILHARMQEAINALAQRAQFARLTVVYDQTSDSELRIDVDVEF